MNDVGVFIRGILVGSEVSRFQTKDGKDQYDYLIVCGITPYRVTSLHNYPDLQGTNVTFCVRPRGYNNAVYYNGDLVEE